MSFTNATAVANLVTFLTSPLMLSYPATTIALLQLTLIEAFTPVFASKPAFTFTLSLTGLPPSLICVAAITCNVFWHEWASALYSCYGGESMQLYVTRAQIRVKIQGKEDIVVWSNPDMEELDMMAPVICIARRAVRSKVPAQLLQAAHARRASAQYQQVAIKLPTLPEAQVDAPDSDSDSETTSVFQFSDKESEVSSASSSPLSEPCDLPYLPPRTTQKKSEVKPEVVKYLYQGGCTKVVGGGVMLGSGAPAAPKSRSPSPPSIVRPQSTIQDKAPAWRRKTRSDVLLAPESNCDDWRMRRNVRA